MVLGRYPLFWTRLDIDLDFCSNRCPYAPLFWIEAIMMVSLLVQVVILSA